MIIGDKRKFLSSLVTLKVEIDPDTTAPLDKLSAEALAEMKKCVEGKGKDGVEWISFTVLSFPPPVCIAHLVLELSTSPPFSLGSSATTVEEAKKDAAVLKAIEEVRHAAVASAWWPAATTIDRPQPTPPLSTPFPGHRPGQQVCRVSRAVRAKVYHSRQGL